MFDSKFGGLFLEQLNVQLDGQLDGQLRMLLLWPLGWQLNGRLDMPIYEQLLDKRRRSRV